MKKHTTLIYTLAISFYILVSQVGVAMDRDIAEQYGAMFDALAEPEKTWVEAFYDNKKAPAQHFLQTTETLSLKAELAIIKGVLNPNTHYKAISILYNREHLSPKAEKAIVRLFYTRARSKAVGILLHRSKKPNRNSSLYQLTQEALLSVLSEKGVNPAIREASFKVLQNIQIHHSSIQEQLIAMLESPLRRYAETLLLKSRLTEKAQEKLMALWYHQNIKLQQMVENILHERSLKQTLSTNIREHLHWLPIAHCPNAFSS